MTERSSRLNCPCEYTHHTVSGNARFLLLVSLKNCDETDSEIKQKRQDSAFSISPNVKKFTATTANWSFPCHEEISRSDAHFFTFLLLTVVWVHFTRRSWRSPPFCVLHVRAGDSHFSFSLAVSAMGEEEQWQSVAHFPRLPGSDGVAAVWLWPLPSL